MDEKLPIGQVLPGFQLDPLQDGWTPLQAFVLIKSLDDEGASLWSFRTSEPLNLEELLGVLTVHTELLRRRLVESWDDPE